MINYQKIITACDKNSTISKALVDEFLLYYVARNEGLEENIP